MIDLKELKEKIKLQEKRKIANVSMVDFSLMYEIIDRAIAAENINKQINKALQKISSWELPEVILNGKAASFECLYGSNGARDYMKNLASNALTLIKIDDINDWKPIETAPKNKAILLDIGLPWPVFGIFNTLNDEFSYADMQAENFENATDIYFQTDYEKNPVAWMPLPDIAKKLRSNNNDCSLTMKGINDAQE